MRLHDGTPTTNFPKVPFAMLNYFVRNFRKKSKYTCWNLGRNKRAKSDFSEGRSGKDAADCEGCSSDGAHPLRLNLFLENKLWGSSDSKLTQKILTSLLLNKVSQKTCLFIRCAWISAFSSSFIWVPMTRSGDLSPQQNRVKENRLPMTFRTVCGGLDSAGGTLQYTFQTDQGFHDLWGSSDRQSRPRMKTDVCPAHYTLLQENILLFEQDVTECARWDPNGRPD